MRRRPPALPTPVRSAGADPHPLRRILLAIPAVAVALAVLGAAPAHAAGPVRAPGTARPATAVQTTRACGAASAGRRTCFALRRTDLTQPAGVHSLGITPNAAPSGLGPSSLQSAYKTPSANGSGRTVAVVDAYDDPNAESDLATYRSQYGLPACTTANGCFGRVNQNGAASPLPSADSGWAGEISLDVDMVSAICPSCHILLVEADSANDIDLYTAENTAVSLGAKFVSNSWGGAEYSGQTSDDSYFNHPGVAITVSSGDDGTGASYPAASRYVTAVGGTRLAAASNSRGWTETAWSSAGSGCSAYDIKPTWQAATTNCSRRAEADVSAVADPATGVAVYQTYGASGWTVYGGTSVSAPIVASVYALAGAPPSSSYPASFPYAHASALFDVTSGSNGGCGAPICSAGTGWDGPTGLGTPNGITAFSGATSGNTVTVTNPGAQTATAGTAFSLQIRASDSASGQTLTYAASGLPAGLSISSGTGLISGTPTTSGSFTVSVTVTDGTGASGSTSFGLTVSGTGGSCTGAQLFGNPGFETGSASPWSATSGVISANGSGETSHGGTYFAWLDGYGRTHTDTLSQSVTIPAACTRTTLTFWLRVDTSETTTTTAYDRLTVKVGSTTLATYSNLNKGAYSQKSFSLGGYAGQTVTVTFTGTEDSLLQTSFVIDDTAVSTG